MFSHVGNAKIKQSASTGKYLDGQHGEDGESNDDCDEVARGLFEGVRQELREDHPDHGPSRKHEPSGQRVGRSEPSSGDTLDEGEGQRPYPGRYSRKQGEEKDFDRSRRVHATHSIRSSPSLQPALA